MKLPALHCFAFVLGVVVCGCNPKETEQGSTEPVKAEAIEGRWHLVRVGGKPPESLNIKSLHIEFMRDGLWKGEAELSGSWKGTSAKFSGSWSVENSVVNYTAGDTSGTSRATLRSGRLVLDPDFVVRKDETAAVIGEYER